GEFDCYLVLCRCIEIKFKNFILECNLVLKINVFVDVLSRQEIPNETSWVNKIHLFISKFSVNLDNFFMDIH
ncbi:MAG: hypothetical protein ACUVQP_11855, partial [Bacteroidales bacterium]